jgi:hypothetical protein
LIPPGGPLQLKPEQKLVSAHFNLDNGPGKILGVYLQENAAVRPIFEKWMGPFRDLSMTTLTTRNTGSTDHISFDEVGIPGFQAFPGIFTESDNLGRQNLAVNPRFVQSPLSESHGRAKRACVMGACDQDRSGG